MPKYIKVAKVNEMPPGTAREFHANGKVIALFNVDGKLYATDSTCLHHGGPLGQGPLEGEVVTAAHWARVRWKARWLPARGTAGNTT
jgi:nitrite reductase/ring-hydroxylating ferredoxin subunit